MDADCQLQKKILPIRQNLSFNFSPFSYFFDKTANEIYNTL